MRKLNTSPSSQKLSDLTPASRRKASTRLYDMLEREVDRLTVMTSLLTLTLIISTVMLVIAVSIVASFRLHQLSFVSSTFLSAPITMIIATTSALLLALSGALGCRRKKQYNIFFALSGLAALVLILVLVSVILSFLVKSDIENQLNKVNVVRTMSRAAEEPAVMRLWDSLQTRYQCCGVLGSSGYKNWEPHLNGSYPDSCCVTSYPNCGRDAHKSLESDFSQTVYTRLQVRGCMTTVKHLLDQFVSPLLLTFSILGLALSSLLLTLIFLAALYGWYLLKVNNTGTRIGSETLTELEPCPVHGGKKSSTISRSEDKKVSSISRQSKPSRSRRE